MVINDEMVEKSCIYCEETIPADSHRCRYCGSIQRKIQAKTEYPNRIIKDESSYSNSSKVFMAVLYTLIPGIGQIAGIIHGITMVNSKGKDKRSFGKSLIIAMVLVFAIYCTFIYMSVVALVTIYYYIS